MKVCFLIDELEKLAPYKDSSIDLMLEAQQRGYPVSFCELTDVSLRNAGVSLKSRTLTLQADIKNQKKLGKGFVDVGDVEEHPISDYDIIFIRKDPPFDTNYLALTLLLASCEQEVRFVNSPNGLRNISEKLSAHQFAQYMPDTFVSFDVARLMDFARLHEKVVLKPAFLGSGKGLFLSSASDEDFEKHVNVILTSEPKGPVIAQEFLPEVVNGDTRVMVLDGNPLAALGRKPPAGDFRANIAVGGSEFAVEMSAVQKRISLRVGELLKANGIVFAGLDFIGNKLIEINVTSPTLIQELRRVSGFDMSAAIFDHLEKSLPA